MFCNVLYLCDTYVLVRSVLFRDALPRSMSLCDMLHSDDSDILCNVLAAYLMFCKCMLVLGSDIFVVLMLWYVLACFVMFWYVL